MANETSKKNAQVPPLTSRAVRGGPGVPIYKLNVTKNALVLGLKQGAAWPSFAHDSDGTTLYLSSFKVNGGDNILEGPVPVARVIPAPSIVNGEEKLIYARRPREKSPPPRVPREYSAERRGVAPPRVPCG